MKNKTGLTTMKTIRLEITTQQPRLNIRSEPPQIHIRQERATFQTHVRPARMHVDRQLPVFSVDRGNAETLLNQLPMLEQLKSSARQAGSTALAGIARIAREGDRLMRIYDRHQSIASLIADRAAQPSTINVVALSKPRLSWEPGRMEVSWEPHEVMTDWELRDPVRVEVTPGVINIQLERPAHVQIRAVPAGENGHLEKNGPILRIV
ncbi:MAG: hypothetical protein GX153_08340 [Clostridiaceae bacterium]|jgi:hypothetical protein|nr:hypothetical protein [Clostridiaceae bacterium]